MELGGLNPNLSALEGRALANTQASEGITLFC